MANRYIPVYRVALVRESTLIGAYGKCFLPATTAAMIHDFIGDSDDREHFGEVLLDAKHNVIGILSVATGTLSACIVSPANVLKPVIIQNAVIHNVSAIILWHNHPSGDCEPSQEDIKITQRICEAAQLFDVKVLDHIIVGTGLDRKRNHISFHERDLL